MVVPRWLPSLPCLFFAICFLQSGLDKVFDRAGNLEWLVPHFAKTPFKSMVPIMLRALTALELTTGLVCAIGVFQPLLGLYFLRTLSLALACLTLCALFAGQRISKDYAGAGTLAIYFAVALIGLESTSRYAEQWSVLPNH
ncbi:MAG: DoxX family protein [Fimbriimonas ginsengisoli]|uniref:DoxX family protein n=1 Tax=Fimbriimonas ginsengisoli TaxID=1005039 RepID=A0A931LSX4_FIMGI|nr:DoxX family protein [Fimbriimonas ginsengisoli]